MAMRLRFEHAGAVYYEMIRSDGSKAIVIGKDSPRIAEAASCRALEENL
jgi:hypothetical protein